MPKAYAVVTYRSVSDAEKLATYAKLAGPAVAPFGARSLLAAMRQSPLHLGFAPTSHTTNKDNTVWPIIASLSQVGRP